MRSCTRSTRRASPTRAATGPATCGITEHLDYLSWLGVTVLWLNPCFASPMRDAGYDVADYFTIDPRYGDNNDLAALAGQARRRGIRLLLDLVAGYVANNLAQAA